MPRTQSAAGNQVSALFPAPRLTCCRYSSTRGRPMTSDVETDELLELAECCERATGPDSELDAAIHHAVPMGVFVSDFTASLDAAMTLVPEGWRVTTEDASFQKAAWLHPKNGQNRGII